jgi:hypothetical protein
VKIKCLVYLALCLLLAGRSAHAQDLVDGFDYPIGESHDEQGNLLWIPERITDEKNDVFRDKLGFEVNNFREGTPSVGAWYNANDVGNFVTSLGGLHPGEDWNLSGDDDQGKPVLAVASGYVHDISPMCGGEARKCGWQIILRHSLPNPDGENTSPWSMYSVYGHITSGSHEDGALADSVEEFTYQPGSRVERGDQIARIAVPTDQIIYPHLHLELRTEAFSYDHGNNNGYYADEPGAKLTDMTLEQVGKAFDLMYEDGILDPSDFIESCRPGRPCVLFVRRRQDAERQADLLRITGLHFLVEGQAPVVALSRSQGDIAGVSVDDFNDSVIQVRVDYLKNRSQFEEGGMMLTVQTSQGSSEELRIPFSDVGSDDWADREVAHLWIRGIVDGKSLRERFYDRSAFVTRAEFLKMVLGVLGRSIQNGRDPWYAPHLEAGAEVRNENDHCGANGACGPDDTCCSLAFWSSDVDMNGPLRREEAARLIYTAKLLSYLGDEETRFLDVSGQNAFRKYIVGCELGSFMQGDLNKNGQPLYTFRPSEGLNRVEAAVLLVRAFLQDDGIQP